MTLLKLAHIALAVLAVGTNLSFPIWVRLAERDGSHLAFTLRAIRWMDRRVTIPAYALVAVTGVTLAVGQGIPLTTPWLAGAMTLFALAAAVGILLYAPVSRRRLAAAERGGPAGRAYLAERRRSDLLDLVIVPMVLAILALMVLRPA